MPEKVSVQVSVFCGPERHNWINPQLCNFLVGLESIRSRGERKIDISFIAGQIPHDSARNLAAKNFVNSDFDWLLMVDNDQAPWVSVLEMFDGASDEMDVIVPRFFCLTGGGNPTDVHAKQNLRLSLGWYEMPVKQYRKGEWMELSCAGTGVMAIRRRVFEKLKRPPHFKFGYDSDGIMSEGEDQFFCRKVRAAGMQIWGNCRHEAGHMHSIELSFLARIAGFDGQCFPSR